MIMNSYLPILAKWTILNSIELSVSPAKDHRQVHFLIAFRFIVVFPFHVYKYILLLVDTLVTRSSRKRKYLSRHVDYPKLSSVSFVNDSSCTRHVQGAGFTP
ncbi:putative leucine-rich repeat extensin-like protein 7 [Iris pallida]|uniref:Leucine-rich repeat extensin-like protein 7 n=1 Tax=Iris pallida TaxID=29817 RepID=A0AAX6IHU3_IRIPA|nr:putative leucine-rich repeat extensin-like protein 7 [Iris pallida]